MFLASFFVVNFLNWQKKLLHTLDTNIKDPFSKPPAMQNSSDSSREDRVSVKILFLALAAQAKFNNLNCKYTILLVIIKKHLKLNNKT